MPPFAASARKLPISDGRTVVYQDGKFREIRVVRRADAIVKSSRFIFEGNSKRYQIGAQNPSGTWLPSQRTMENTSTGANLEQFLFGGLSADGLVLRPHPIS